MRRLALLVLALLTWSVASAEAQWTVARVIDGDTFELSDGRRVRLIGIDTPEKYPSDKMNRDASRTGQDRATIRALGERASDFAAGLVEGKEVELEFDQANAGASHRDRYGRTLAYVWLLGDGVRTTLVNRLMVSSGYASAYTEYPFRYAEEFRLAEQEARAASAGLWASDPMPRAGTADGDRDCGDFRTHREAQTFFESTGPGDPHRLDADGDGLACESLR